VITLFQITEANFNFRRISTLFIYLFIHSFIHSKYNTTGNMHNYSACVYIIVITNTRNNHITSPEILLNSL